MVRVRMASFGMMVAGASGCVSLLGDYGVLPLDVGPEAGPAGLPDARAFEGADAAPPSMADAAGSTFPDATLPAPDGGGLSDGGACGRSAATNNVLRQSKVEVSSTYPGGYEGARLNDGDFCTSWYSKAGACVSIAGVYTCSDTSITFTFASPTLLRTAVLFANRDGFKGDLYNVKSAKLVAHTVRGLSVSAPFEFSGNPNDGKAVLALPVSVTSIDIQVLTAGSPGPGLGEIEAYAD